MRRLMPGHRLILRAAPHLAVFLLVGALYALGFLDFLETQLRDTRFQLLQRPASGQLLVVEIDGPSRQELQVWPWPRRYHAQVLERLRQAGARRIAFDFDFGFPTTPTEDLAFEQALVAAEGRAILSAYMLTSTGWGGSIQATHLAPLAAFTRHGGLASVNFERDADSRARRAAMAVPWGRDRLPSLFAALAGNKSTDTDDFYVDFGIQPSSIPRLSYADVLAGRFDAEDVAGRDILIGATTIELGNHLAVPVHGILSSTVFQALAYESLVQGRQLHRPPVESTLLFNLLLALLFGALFTQWSWRLGAAMLTGLLCTLTLLSLAQQAWFGTLTDVTPWILTLVLCYAVSLIGEIKQQDLYLMAQGLAVKRSETIMSQAIETTQAGFALFDRDDRIVLCNSRFREFLFNDRDLSVVGWRYEDALCESAQRRRIAMKDTTPAAWVEACLIRHREPTSSHGQELSNGTFLQINERETSDGGVVAIYTDVTQLRQREAHLRAAVEEAEFASRGKTEFLANMSHELRTPLNAIIGFAQTILLQVQGPVGSPKYSEYLGDIHDSAQHLLGIINDLLDVSKIETGTSELSEQVVDVGALVAGSLRLISERAEAAGLAVKTCLPDPLPNLYADERRIKQILLNLLSNAVKFTRKGGLVTIAVSLDPEQALCFEIGDNGIGIAPSDVPKALSLFGQIDGSLARNHEGTGLGLPLTKSLVELHGGTFQLRSALGKGTTVTLRFPPSRTRPRGQARGSSPTTTSSVPAAE